MEEFKKKLQKNNKIYKLFIIISLLCIAAIIAFRIINERTGSGSDPQSGILGFFASMAVVSSIFIKRNKKALNNEKLLKELYIRNTDERNNQIMCEASKTSFLISFTVISAAVLISGYFNYVVSCTLAFCMAFIIIVYLVVTAYYNRKI